MSAINKHIIIGHIGQDPETRSTHAGNAVTNFSVATTAQWKDKESGERQERTDWHSVVAFGKLAEICEKYATKGRQDYYAEKDRQQYNGEPPRCAFDCAAD